MQISLNWLKKYVDLPRELDAKEFALKLTMSTVEVDGYEILGENLDKIVVGKINKLDKHPNADKLRLAFVDVGDREIKVVCGGTNLTEGMLVAMAMPGARVRWHGQGDLITLEKAKVRGEESEGMICASDEIGLGNMFPAKNEGEIVDLSEGKYKIGQPLAEALQLDDVVYEIDNKSLTNRPDLWGHYGMAREAAALYDLKLKKYQIDKFFSSKEMTLKVMVEDTKACPRYLGIVVKGVKIAPSPAWLRRNLESIGQKSINNIVDITNYVMYDLGQPLHAFSADKIRDMEIFVRRARDNERLVTIDGEERNLISEDLVIADADKAIALAGIMGAQNSEIDDNTNLVIIESANFEPYVVRKASSRLGLRTEAAMRFEKSLDPALAEQAIRRVIDLIKEIIPSAEVVSDLIDVNNSSVTEEDISITTEFINRKIGFVIPEEKIKQTLFNLGFAPKKVKGGFKLTIPTWRHTKDISLKEDLIEEISRIYGYDNITPEMPLVKMEVRTENTLRDLERRVKEILVLQGGASEVYNYSWIDGDFLAKIKQPIRHVELINSVTDNLKYLRRSLVPNLLNNIKDNLRFSKNVNVFEIGKVFLPEEKGEDVGKGLEEFLPNQPVKLGGVLTQENLAKEDVFLQAKGLVEGLFDQLDVKINYEIFSGFDYWCHPKQSLQIFIGKESIGYISVLHPLTAEVLGINQSSALWEIDLQKVLSVYPSIIKYSSLAKFPEVELDLAIVVDNQITWKDIYSLIKAVNPEIVRKVELFDVYKSGKIKAGTKSLAFRITYQSDERTLTMEEVGKMQEKIIEQLQKGVKAEIRK